MKTQQTCGRYWPSYTQYVRSSISVQQTRINIHLSLRGQNNSHHAALLSTHSGKVWGLAPLSWTISRDQWYLWLDTFNQWQPISKLQQSLIYSSTWDCSTQISSRSKLYPTFFFRKREGKRRIPGRRIPVSSLLFKRLNSEFEEERTKSLCKSRCFIQSNVLEFILWICSIFVQSFIGIMYYSLP